VARKTENFFFYGVQLGIRQRLGEAKIDLPIDIELDDGNDDTWLISIQFVCIFTYAQHNIRASCGSERDYFYPDKIWEYTLYEAPHVYK